MTRGRSLAVALALLCSAGPAFAGPASPQDRADARERFDRAIRLFNDGDNAAALAELRRVQEIVPAPVVLYNIGLVAAAMGRPVEAVDALDRLLSAPGALSSERIARAQATRAEQAKRVGAIAVTASVEGAVVDVDGLEAGKTPLPGPLRVASGKHVVGVSATGYLPLRREISVAGGVEAKAAFAPLPAAGRLAHLAIATHLPDAEVVVDGEIAGHTPLPATLALAPGAHRIELRRAGYGTVQRDLVLGDGAEGEISAEPEEDAVALASEGGALALDLSETHAVVAVDGRTRGGYRGSLRLALGAHRIRVERGGFAPVERDVSVTKGGTTTVRIRFEPNPDTRVVYGLAVERRRTWGIATAVGGAAITAAGIVALGYTAAQAPSACDDTTTPRVFTCQSYRNGEVAGGVGIAIGAAAIVTGVALLATGDDPHRYDRPPSGETLASLPLSPAVWGRAGGAGLAVVGRF